MHRCLLRPTRQSCLPVRVELKGGTTAALEILHWFENEQARLPDLRHSPTGLDRSAVAVRGSLQRLRRCVRICRSGPATAGCAVQTVEEVSKVGLHLHFGFPSVRTFVAAGGGRGAGARLVVVVLGPATDDMDGPDAGRGAPYPGACSRG